MSKFLLDPCLTSITFFNFNASSVAQRIQHKDVREKTRIVCTSFNFTCLTQEIFDVTHNSLTSRFTCIAVNVKVTVTVLDDEFHHCTSLFRRNASCNKISAITYCSINVIKVYIKHIFSITEVMLIFCSFIAFRLSVFFHWFSATDRNDSNVLWKSCVIPAKALHFIYECEFAITINFHYGLSCL